MARDKREEEEQKPKFRVIDRRQEPDSESDTHAKPPITEASPKEEEKKVVDAPSPHEAGAPEEEQEMTEEEKEQIRKEAEASLKFSNTVVFILRTLAEQTWIHLGLIPNPLTNLTVKNLEEARKSIDLYGHIAKFAEAEFEPALRKDIERLLTDLRMNYTSQLGS